ncbi:MAG: hypothetical protein HND42_06635 [Armatimonadetes bacterium]|nr:ComEC family competence protein [Armatimonadota bacterium]NOG92903.1 hypothetical protein [Armatimonadota bacterium]
MQRFEERYRHFLLRPLVSCFPTFLGAALSGFSPWYWTISLLGIWTGRRWPFLNAALLLLGFWRAMWGGELPYPITAPDRIVEGRVIGSPTMGQRTQRILVDSGKYKVLVHIPWDRHVALGDYVRVRGELQGILPSRSEDGDPFDRYWLTHGVNEKMSVVWSGSFEVVEANHSMGGMAAAWRYATWDRLSRHMGRQDAGVAMAVLTGQQALVDEDLIEAMRRAGTLHLLAASGYNVMVLAAGAFLLLARFPIPRAIQVTLVFFLLAAYCMAVGYKPSIVRASLMAAAYLLSTLALRTPDGLSSIALAGIIYLLCEPGSAFDAGFQLSFLAVTGLVLFSPGLFQWAKKQTVGLRSKAARRAITAGIGILGTTLIAHMFTAPVVAAHFGMLSLVSPLANGLTAFAVPVIYMGEVLSAGAFAFSEPASALAEVVTHFGVAWMRSVNEFVGNVPGAALEFPPIPSAAAVGLCAIPFLLSRERGAAAPEQDAAVF